MRRIWIICQAVILALIISNILAGINLIQNDKLKPESDQELVTELDTENSQGRPSSGGSQDSPTSRGIARTLTQDHGSNIIELKQNESKPGLSFQLPINMSIVNASLTIMGLPSFEYTTWDDLSVVSTGSNDGVSVTPVITADNNGGSHLVWRDNGNIMGSGTDKDIIYSKRLGDTWQTFSIVSTAKLNSESESPDLIYDPAEKIHFVWVDDANYNGCGDDQDIFYRNKENHQDVWSPIFIISNETGFNSSLDPKITINRTGDIFIVWMDNESFLSGDPDFDIFCRVYHTRNLTFSPTMIISDITNNGESRDPEVAADGDKVHVVWADDGDILGSGSDNDIILRTWDGTSWNAPLVISNDTNDGDSTVPVVDASNGTTCIAWQDTGDINNSGLDNDIIMKKAMDSIWSESIVISNHSNDGDSINPDIDIDSNENMHIVWSDDVQHRLGDFDNDIIYRRFDHETARLSNYILISDDSTSGDADKPRIFVKNDAGIKITWENDGDIHQSGFDLDIIYRNSKFIYPTNLKLQISTDIDSIITDEISDWLYPGELKTEVVIDDSWLENKLNTIIEQHEGPIVNCHLIFKSDTNGSVKITSFKTDSSSTPAPPTNLQIIGEELTNVVSHNPQLAWDFSNNGNSSIQSGFEVQVGSMPGVSDMWDFGPITNKSEYTIYNGASLLDNETYHFRVRVSDNLGAWSRWSPWQNFTMNARPRIKTLTPVTGIADEYIDLEWLGSDANGDSLIYTVEALYNNNWHRLLDNSTLTTFRLTTMDLPAPQSVDFQAKCFDSYESSIDWLNPAGAITIIHNNPPDVRIITPPKYNAIANNSYLIQWESIDLDVNDAHEINIYYDIDNNFTNKTEIILDLPDTGSHLWDSSEIEKGQYYICIEISDFKSSRYRYSDGVITIDHTFDTDPPRVEITHPKPDSVNVSINEEIRVRFNRDMDTKTITSEFFYVTDSLDRKIDGIIYYDNAQKSIIFWPSHLDYNQIYTVTLTTGIKDTSGNSLDGNRDRIPQGSPIDDYVWMFSTIPWAGDVSPPYILSVSPKDHDSEINIRPIITAIFSENIAHESLTPSSVYIIDSLGNFINAEIFFISDRNELRISFYDDLEFESEYTIWITSTVRDVSGRGLDGNEDGISEGSPIDDFVWSFTTKESDIPLEVESTDNGFRITDFYLVIIVVIIVLILVIGSIVKQRGGRRKFVVNDIFVIYNDGRLLAHQSFESKIKIDKTSMGGMLTAIQNFVTESFIDSDSEILEEIKYGKLKIALVHGNKIYLAVICSGDMNKQKFNNDMKKVLELIEAKFEPVLNNWDGNMKKVRDIQDLIRF